MYAPIYSTQEQYKRGPADYNTGDMKRGGEKRGRRRNKGGQIQGKSTCEGRSRAMGRHIHEVTGVV